MPLFCKESFIRTWPRPFIYTLFVAVESLQWRPEEVQIATVYPFTGVCQPWANESHPQCEPH